MRNAWESNQQDGGKFNAKETQHFVQRKNNAIKAALHSSILLCHHCISPPLHTYLPKQTTLFFCTGTYITHWKFTDRTMDSKRSPTPTHPVGLWSHDMLIWIQLLPGTHVQLCEVNLYSRTTYLHCGDSNTVKWWAQELHCVIITLFCYCHRSTLQPLLPKGFSIAETRKNIRQLTHRKKEKSLHPSA